MRMQHTVHAPVYDSLQHVGMAWRHAPLKSHAQFGSGLVATMTDTICIALHALNIAQMQVMPLILDHTECNIQSHQL